MKYSLVIILFVSSIILAQEPETITFHTKEFKPLVYVENNVLTGFDVELAAAVSNEIGCNYEIINEHNFKNVLDQTQIKSDSDLSIAGITITAEREKIMDFSIPYIKTGLGILVLDKKKSSILDNIKTAIEQIGTPILYLFAFLVVASHIIWLMEMGSNAIDDKYFPGIFQSMWFIYITLTTIGYGDITPRKWTSRIVVLFVTLFGFGFFANIVAKMSAENVLNKQSYYIQTERDLRDRKVGTEENTSSISTLHKIGATPIECANLREAYGLLLLGDIDAIVFDKLALIDFAKSIKYKNIAVLEHEFDIQYYGIAMSQGSNLREPVNNAILNLMESGKLDKLKTVWIK